MPVAVPNSFYQKYNQYNNIRYNNDRYNNNFIVNEIDNLMEENQPNYYYLSRLEQKVRRLENINNIFLNILRENISINNRDLYRNYSYNDLSSGSYPYLSFDNNKNKTLVYLNKDSINNNKIMNGKYKDKYLLPILPKYNSVSDNNKIAYLLNKEKLKYFNKNSRNEERPYFYYNLEKQTNIPQKINSVQYFNQKMDIKKYNSTSNINADINEEKISKGKSSISNLSIKNINSTDIRNEINKLNINLKRRLSKIENLQKTQKKDIDYLMNKSKGNISENTSKKENNKTNSTNKSKKEDKKMDKKEDKKEDKKDNKKEDKKDNKKNSGDDSDDDSEDEEDEEEDDEDDENE